MHGIETECLYRVHFLVDLLRANLSREGGARPPRKHDRGHQRPKFAQHGDAHPIHHEDNRAELLRDQPDLERDDHAHQEADKQHDRNRVSSGFGGNAHHLTPADQTTMADCVPERAGALAQKTGNRLHVRNFLCGSPPDVLEDSDLWTPRRRLLEVLRIECLDERGEVGGEIPHLDFCLRRPVAAKQVEEQGNAHIVGVLEPRGVDNNGAVWITRQCIERILPDRCRSVSGDSALQHHLHAVIRTQLARCGSRHLTESTTWPPICRAVPKARPGWTGLALSAQDRRWSSTPFRPDRVSRAISRPYPLRRLRRKWRTSLASSAPSLA